ncbi:MAG: FG-GAP-like repeat-containing protein, partial [Candidatus Korobacteraceae bacterium]
MSCTVILLTCYCLGLSQAAYTQSVKPSPIQSLQTASPASSTLSPPATPKPNTLPTFLVAPSLALSGAPSSIAAGDLNGDGKLDLVVANFDTAKISILLGQGNGTFATPVDYPVGKQPTFVLVGDVNGDGKLDVVVCNEADGTLNVLFGNGDGTLQKPVTYRTVPEPVYLVLGDFNGDGKPDLAVAGNASKTIAVLLNDGTGNFSQAVPYNIGHAPRSLAVADFDGDGHLDLASANADGSVSILLGRGDGSFRAISSLNVATVALSSVVSGDFNGDGKLDLAVTEAGTKLLTVLLGKGDGTFQAGLSYTVGSNPAFVIATDVNNDNIPDLVTANQSGNTFSVLLGNGDGTFKPSLDFTVGNSPRALVSGDFNGDGRTDLAIVNFSDRTVSVPLGNGDGTFQAARAYNVDLDRKSVAAGDLDGDGKPDLVVTNFCGTDTTCASNGTVSVLLAVGDGTYKFAASYPLGAGPLSVALADVNGDKKLDLIAVNRGDRSVSLLLGNGDGTFQSALTYPAGNSPVSLAVGDFNKDGKPDLAIAGDCGSATCSQTGEVSILLGNGDGSFQSAATYAVGYSPSSIVAGDVNGDTNLDLVVANACGKDSSCQSNGTATVLLGDGKGGFTSAGDVQLGNTPSAATLGDLNGDGVLDLLAVYRADNKVGVLLGNGDGTFRSQVTYQVGTAPSAVVTADFNGDGKRDVAVANFKDSKVSVLFGNGDGTLQTAVHYPVGVGPESLITIDPNNSGHADLVTANGNGGLTPQGSDVTVLRNLAPAGLQPVFTNLTPSQMITYGTPTITLGGKICAGPQCVPMGEQVTITIQGQPPQTATINDNTGDFSTTYPTGMIPSGTYTITYSYAGDAMFNPASDSSTKLTVSAATPVFSNLTPYAITYGTASITVSGTICVPGGLCPPQGEQVTITVQGQPPQIAMISDNSGDFSTSYPTATIPVGSYPIMYSYPGDSNFTPASTTGPPVTVNQATTTTVVSAVPSSPSSYNQDIMFTATVTGANGGNPTGTVSFTADGNAIPNCTGLPLMSLKNGTGKQGSSKKASPQGNGSAATCDVPTGLPVGQHTIQATYSGDSNYQGSSGMLQY